MAAKAGPRGAERRGTLLRAAYELVATAGFEGLRTRDVATRANVNIATLHYYFPSKETLIRGVLEYAMERFRTTMPATGTPADQLRAHFQGIRRLVRREPELFAVMGELALRSVRDDRIREIYEHTTDIWHATIRGLLAKGLKDGSLSGPRDIDAQTSLVVAALMGASMIPVSAKNRLSGTLAELERSLGLTLALLAID